MKKKVSQKNLRWHKDRAWKAMSQYVRMKHADESGYSMCYTCGVAAHWKELQAGHAIQGRHGKVLFDEEIIRPQCLYCNVMRRGEYGRFAAKLIQEHGLEWYIKKQNESHGLLKMTRGDYDEIAEKCLNWIRERL
jgi:hypothetical protein